MTALPHPVPTPLDRSGMRAALATGHALAFGTDPSPQALAMALAMCCLEHANGHALWCWDFGNLDLGHGGDWTGDTFPLRQKELLHGEIVYMTKLMRAYESAAKGAEGYWKLLDEPRFAYGGVHVMLHFDAGNVAQACAALKAGGWFTATLASYTHEMVQLYRECLRVT